MTSAHYTQTLDLGEDGTLECTRDDTPEEVKYHLLAWKDGVLTHEIKIRYNIMYDYVRCQHWWNGQLIKDELGTPYHYGHLIAEGCSTLNFKDGFEPVNPLGCELFQKGQLLFVFQIPESRVEVWLSEFPSDPYDSSRQGIEHIGSVFGTTELNDYGILYWTEGLERLKHEFDPIKARDARLRFYTEKLTNGWGRRNQTYSEWLRTEVPIDMSMVD